MIKLQDILGESESKLSGNVKIKHYSKNDLGSIVTLSPRQAKNFKNYYTNNDYKLSDFPRVFYYTYDSNVELQVKSQHKYVGTVKGNRLFYLKYSIERFLNKESDDIENKILKGIVTVSGGINNYDMLLKRIKKYYDGVYYTVGNYKIINMFIDLKVKRED